ncbi:hypothetical protein, partial [Klebsiella variicola]|uniref:hypothetical protein n=1 Tax=Klebsiella variicola TaxID=244366 RepID=UPI0007D6CE85
PLPVLRDLLGITFELLSWQAANGVAVDSHYLKSTFGLAGEDWDTETARFMDSLPAAVTCTRAEMWLRPLAGYCFDLATFPDETLAGIFTVARLKAIFPLLIHARNWDMFVQEKFIEELKPQVSATTVALQAGPVQLEIRVEGQADDLRSAAWYETPRLYLMLSGPNFIVPFNWAHFSELLRALQVWHAGPEQMPRGYHGHAVMFSPPGSAADNGFLGFDALRVFLTAGEFESLVSQLVNCAAQAPFADVLNGLRAIYGDL